MAKTPRKLQEWLEQTSPEKLSSRPRPVRGGTKSDRESVSESASIFVMELVAIGVDLWLGGGTSVAEPRFWSTLSISLTMGFLAAIPVNAWLVARGIKEGMHDPRHVAHAH